jgi:hypothetical protein
VPRRSYSGWSKYLESYTPVLVSYILTGSLVKAPRSRHPLSSTPAGSPPPHAFGEDRDKAIQSASRVRVGTRSNDLRAWTPFPVTASNKGAGRSHKLNAGHTILEVAVENSWPCMTGGPSGRDDLSKSRRDLLAVAQSTRSRARRAAHHCAMKRYEQPIKMAPRDDAGLIGKARPRTLNVVDKIELRSGLRPKGRAAAGAPMLQKQHTASAGTDQFHRCMKPSVSVCMKLTSAFSSSSGSPSRPTNLVFMLSADSGGGQHVVPSPGSLVPQRRRTSRVL